MSYKDTLGDQLYVAPPKAPAEPEKSVSAFEKRYPELTRKLQQAALELGRARGRITSDDIWDLCPVPDGIEPRIMGVAFRDKKLWRQTGEYVKSRRPSRHKAPISVWEFRGEQAA